jgi:hypothetical protein
MKIATDRIPDTALFDSDHIIGTATYPMVQITQVSGETITQTRGSDKRYSIGWPVQVTIVADDDLNVLDNDDLYSYWRQMIIDSFVSQSLAGVGTIDSQPLIWYTTVEPQAMVNTDAFISKDKFISAVVFRFHERRQTNTVAADPIALVED